MEKKSKTPLDRIWNFLASVKLAVVLFALIALTSIIGTVLEQQAEPAKNLQVIGKIFGDSIAPELYKIFDALGFMDMYRSWWFVMLLGLFAANLIICSIDRFPSIWRVVREPIKPLEEAHLKVLPIKNEFTIKGNPEKVKEKAGAALKSAGFNFTESKDGGGYQLFSEKGRLGRLGVFITHLSFLLILVGAIIGIYLGFKGFVNLPEGASYPMAFTRTPLTEKEANEREFVINAMEASGGDTSQAAQRIGVTEQRLRARMKMLGIRPLGFLIKCNDFEVSFYEGTDMPKEYASNLSVIDEGNEVQNKWIEVNDPLKYKGITFYQSSYGLMPNSSNVVYILRVTSASGASETLRLKEGDKFVIPGTDIEAMPMGFSPSLTFDESGRPFTYNPDLMNNPAVHLDIKDKGREIHKWVLKRAPETGRLEEGHLIELIDLWGMQYTGLQVRQDPGVWIVYLGCAIMSIGLYIAFFMSHKRVWIRLKGEKGATKVMVGAYANKNRQAFERKIDKIISLLREGGK